MNRKGSLMISQVTQDVKVSVEALYQPEYSDPESAHFMFAYRITIENQGTDVLQLLRRHWDIFDAIGEYKKVDGEGVVGEQPVLKPGEIHQYASGCNLKSEMGFMEGFYQMQNLQRDKTFEVRIPRFNLMANFRLN